MLFISTQHQLLISRLINSTELVQEHAATGAEADVPGLGERLPVNHHLPLGVRGPRRPLLHLPHPRKVSSRGALRIATGVSP